MKNYMASLVSFTILLNFSYPVNAQVEIKPEPESVTVEQIRSLYPNAIIKQVSPEAYLQVRKSYSSDSVELLAPTDQTMLVAQAQQDGASNGSPVYNDHQPPLPSPLPSQSPVVRSRGDCAFWEAGAARSAPGSKVAPSNEAQSPERQPGSIGNFNMDFRGGTGGSGGKDFLVVIAVIGVVVVAALLIYSGGYLYEMVSNGFECRAWNEIGVRHSSISDSSEQQTRSGFLNGVYLSKGYFVPYGILGLTAEIGHHGVDLKITGLNFDYKYNGSYLMLGPTFSFPFGFTRSHFFQLELLGGTSNLKEIGLLSTLRLGVVLNVHPRVNIGANMGAALVNIKSFGNYISDYDQLNYLYGISTTIKW
jgi:hypothetical protein